MIRSRRPSQASLALFALVIAGGVGTSRRVTADDATSKQAAPSNTSVAAGKQASPGAADAPVAHAEERALITKYCVGCHSVGPRRANGVRQPKGGLDLVPVLAKANEPRFREIWDSVRDAVKSGDMPPSHRPRPSNEEVDKIVAWISGELAKTGCDGLLDPGRVTMRRLNRVEYNNTIRDLLGVDVRPADSFPSDDVGGGFDNNGDVLSLPPLLMERYLQAAEQIAEAAIFVPDADHAPVRRWEAESLTGKQAGSPQGEGRLLHTNGEVVVSHAFAKPGSYVIRIRAFGQQAGRDPAKMALLIGGKRVHSFDVKAVESEPGVYTYKFATRAGEKPVALAFTNDFYDEKIKDATKRDRNLLIDWFEVRGPIGESSKPLPPWQEKILFTRPSGPSDLDRATRDVLQKLANRAYRRPARRDEVQRLVDLAGLVTKTGDPYERGIQLAITAMLVSPQFLYRIEIDRGPRNHGRIHAISEFELASRLSYFLWSSMPDEELYQLALDRKLRAAGNLEKQTLRMLRDPRSSALVENFATQWLQIRNLRNFNPDRARFPKFNDALRGSMERETLAFFNHVMRDDRPILDFIDADYTFVDERLASLYGLSGVKGTEFRRVALDPKSPRGGLLTQASILAVTSNPTRTSPVKRGKWILEQILGTPPPPPPPNVPELKDSGELKGTLRQRMEQHRSNVSCASCHARMDPLGFGFENFDAVGAWRDKDGPDPVDASGVLPNGKSFKGPRELKAILKERRDEFAKCFCEKMLTYAIGRGLDLNDRCAIDKLVSTLASNDYKFSKVVLGVVASDAFQKRNAKEGK